MRTGRIQRGIEWRLRSAQTNVQNGMQLLGWRRNQRFALASVGEELPVVFCTWVRLERLPQMLELLAAQDVPVQAVIWNNSPDRQTVDDAAARASVDVTVFHSPRNVGGFGRFYMARELREQGHKAAVFIDDDHDFGPSMVRELQAQHRPESMSGWWAYCFRDGLDYPERERVPVGAPAMYLGTGGMIVDTEVFLDPRVFRCPRRFWFVEDLWLSYVAGHLHGWQVFRSRGQFDAVADGRDLYLRLGRTKSRFLRYLLRRGWDTSGCETRGSGRGVDPV